MSLRPQRCEEVSSGLSPVPMPFWPQQCNEVARVCFFFSRFHLWGFRLRLLDLRHLHFRRLHFLRLDLRRFDLLRFS